MHAARAFEEEPHVRRDGRVATEQALKHRRLRARRMRPLRDLSELEGIAEQDDIARG